MLDASHDDYLNAAYIAYSFTKIRLFAERGFPLQDLPHSTSFYQL